MLCGYEYNLNNHYRDFSLLPENNSKPSNLYTLNVPTWATRIAGAALLSFGIPISIFLAFIVVRHFAVGAPSDGPFVIGCGVLAAIAIFCNVVGLTLLLNRPNKYNSILPSYGWYALSATFVLLCLALGIARSRNPSSADVGDVVVPVVSTMLAVFCFRAGKRYAAKGTT